MMTKELPKKLVLPVHKYGNPYNVNDFAHMVETEVDSVPFIE